MEEESPTLYVPQTVREIDPFLRHAINKLLTIRSEHPSGVVYLDLVPIATARIEREHPTIDHDVAEEIATSFARTYIKSNLRNGQLALHENDGNKYPKRYRPGPERMSSYMATVAKRARGIA